jgi:hypothetical protein
MRNLSRTGPVERDVLARIGGPLELEAEGIDGVDSRFGPGPISEPGGFIRCGIFPGAPDLPAFGE